MRLQSLWAALALPLLSQAILNYTSPSPDSYDVIIVGGGPSGLSAASALARVRRKVLLIDSGSYRNEATRHMHDVLGFDGVTPAYYRHQARELIRQYDTVTLVNGTVRSIQTVEEGRNFTVHVSDLPGSTKWNSTNQTVSARRVVLATGLRDVIPDTPGFAENWGKGIYWCPWCDGHEHADQRLGLLGDLKSVPSSVQEVMTLNSDIVAYVNCTDTAAQREEAEASVPEYVKFLHEVGVSVVNKSITALVRLKDGGADPKDPALASAAEHDLFRIEFDDGTSEERDAFLSSWTDEQKSSLGGDMGVRLAAGRLAVDDTKGLVTNVPGVYAVGDANSDNVTNVPHALYSGKRAGVYLHVAISREDTTKVVGLAAAAKREVDLDVHNLWKRMNGEPQDIMYVRNIDAGKI